MKICYIAEAASIHTQRWVKYFSDKGYEVNVISFSPVGDGDIGNAKLYVLKSFPFQIWVISFTINLLLHIIQIKQLVKKIKPDVVDGHFITNNGFLAACTGFHPLIITAWGSDVLIYPKHSFLSRIRAWYAIKKAEIVICDSDIVKEGLIKLGTNPGKIRRILNGVDTQLFNPQQRTEKLRDIFGASQGSVVICIRNLKPIYNIEMLLRAIPIILEQVPGTRFVIGGDGEQRNYLKDLASKLGILRNVMFIGFIQHNQLSSYLASSEIYVSTSLSDSTSLSLQEAMSCELAPVLTNLPANREWVTDGKNGFIVPINNIHMFAERTIYLLKNEELRKEFGKASRELIMEKAEYKKEMEKMEKVYINEIEKFDKEEK
jgi:glycosyltransferase involved in cell wall biosynthesis